MPCQNQTKNNFHLQNSFVRRRFGCATPSLLTHTESIAKCNNNNNCRFHLCSSIVLLGYYCRPRYTSSRGATQRDADTGTKNIWRIYAISNRIGQIMWNYFVNCKLFFHFFACSGTGFDWRPINGTFAVASDVESFEIVLLLEFFFSFFVVVTFARF